MAIKLELKLGGEASRGVGVIKGEFSYTLLDGGEEILANSYDFEDVLSHFNFSKDEVFNSLGASVEAGLNLGSEESLKLTGSIGVQTGSNPVKLGVGLEGAFLEAIKLPSGSSDVPIKVKSLGFEIEANPYAGEYVASDTATQVYLDSGKTEEQYNRDFGFATSVSNLTATSGTIPVFSINPFQDKGIGYVENDRVFIWHPEPGDSKIKVSLKPDGVDFFSISLVSEAKGGLPDLYPEKLVFEFKLGKEFNKTIKGEASISLAVDIVSQEDILDGISALYAFVGEAGGDAAGAIGDKIDGTVTSLVETLASRGVIDNPNQIYSAIDAIKNAQVTSASGSGSPVIEPVGLEQLIFEYLNRGVNDNGEMQETMEEFLESRELNGYGVDQIENDEGKVVTITDQDGNSVELIESSGGNHSAAYIEDSGEVTFHGEQDVTRIAGLRSRISEINMPVGVLVGDVLHFDNGYNPSEDLSNDGFSHYAYIERAPDGSVMLVEQTGEVISGGEIEEMIITARVTNLTNTERPPYPEFSWSIDGNGNYALTGIEIDGEQITAETLTTLNAEFKNMDIAPLNPLQIDNLAKFITGQADAIPQEVFTENPGGEHVADWNEDGDLEIKFFNQEENLAYTSTFFGTTKKIERFYLNPSSNTRNDSYVQVESDANTGKRLSDSYVLNLGGIPLDVGSIANTLGSALGREIFGDSLFAQTTGGILFGAIAENLAETAYEVINEGAISDAVDDAFSDFGVQIRDAAIGAVSSLLAAEIVEELGIDGVAGDFASTVGSAYISEGLDTLITGGEFSVSFQEVSINFIASYIGKEIGSSVYEVKSKEGAIGAGIGAVVGAEIGAKIGTALWPGVGTLIGAAIGYILGGVIGDLFGGTPRSGADVIYNPNTNLFEVANVWNRDDGSKDAARDIAGSAAGILNQVLDLSGGHIIDEGTVFGGTYGMRNQDFTYRPAGRESQRTNYEDAQDLIFYGVLTALDDVQIAGGDIYVKRALYSTVDTLLDGASLGNSVRDNSIDVLLGNITTALEYKNYRDNRDVINQLIALEPNSAFTAGWIVVLEHAKELGLLKRAESDHFGGWKETLSDNRFIADTYLGRKNVSPNYSGVLFTYQDFERGVNFENGEGDTITIQDTISGSLKDQLDFSDQIQLDSELENVENAAIIYGTENADTIKGNNLGNDIFGFDGNDNITGGELADWILGGEGNDTLNAFAGNNNALFGQSGEDILIGGAGSDWLDGGDDNDTITGNLGEDVIEGGQGDDIINGGGGNDVYIFRRGDGADTISDVDSRFINYSVPSQDLQGYSYRTSRGNIAGGYDVLEFGENISLSDVYIRKNGDDLEITLLDSEGNETTDVITLNDWTDAARRIETLRFVDGQEITLGNFESFILGTSGDDTILGTYGNDFIHGGRGDDDISALMGNDVAIGGLGNDIVSGDGDDDLVIGGDGEDNLFGGDGKDVVSGDRGDDTLRGGAGNDVLSGGEGNDTIITGPGDDRILFGRGDGQDIVYDALGENVTVVWSSENGFSSGFSHSTVFDSWYDEDDYLDYSLKNEYYHDLSYGGFSRGAILTYSAGSSTEPQDIGSDTLELKMGLVLADIRFDRDGQNLVIAFENSGGYSQNLEDISDSVTIQGWYGTASSPIEYLNIFGVNRLALTDFNNLAGGNSDDDTFEGSSGRDWYTGGAGQDTINSFEGDDILIGGSDNDTLNAGAGRDWLFGGIGNDHLIGGEGADLLYGDAGEDTADYSDSTAAVSINLVEGFEVDPNRFYTGLGGHAEGDVLDGVEHLIGSSYGDTLIASDEDNEIEAGGVVGAGADLSVGRGGSDNYIFREGDGSLLIAERGLEREYTAGGEDTLTFASGIHLGQLTFAKENELDLRINIIDTSSGESTGDNILIKNWFLDSDDRVEWLNLTDGGRFRIDGQVFNPEASHLADWVAGDSSDNILHGYAGNDIISAGNGSDYLFGGEGDDFLIGGLGTDAFDGGDGIDTVAYFDIDSNEITAGAYVYLDGTAGFWTAHGDTLVNVENVIGTKLFGDVINGDENDNVLHGMGGSDRLIGNGGNDTLYGGAGDDVRLYGGDGDDIIYGGAGDDADVRGDGGNDQIFGEEGDDTLRGYDGDDIISGGSGDDYLWGGNGQDILEGDDGEDYLVGHNGDDSIFGGNGGDTLNGGDQNDLLVGGAGDDTLAGGDDDDRLFGGENRDYLFGGTGNDYLDGGQDRDELHGQSGDDVIYGAEGNDYVYGGDGDDFLGGGEGDDRLRGENHNDVLNGGAGNDSLYGGDNQDIYIFNAGFGVDRISDSYTNGDDNKVLFADHALEELWFSLNGSDLVINVIGAADQVTIVGNTSTDIHTSNFVLTAASVNSLLAAMSTHSTPGSLEELPDAVRQAQQTYWQEEEFALPGVFESAPQLSGRDFVLESGELEVAYTLEASDLNVNETFSYNIVDAPEFGSLSVDSQTGELNYIAHPDFEGTTSAIVSVTDSSGLTTEARVRFIVEVAPVNTAPTSAEFVVTNVNEDGNVLVDPGLYDPDAGDNHTFDASPTLGSVVFNADGTFLYTPFANQFGTDEFTVLITDSAGAETSTTVRVNVLSINDAPQTVPQFIFDTLEETSVAGAIAVFDPDQGDTHTFDITSQANGNVSIDSNGAFVYTPAPDFSGVDSFVVTVTDSAGDSSQTEVVINVSAENDAPQTLSNLLLEATEDQSIAGDLQLTDSDAGDTHSFSASPAMGVIDFNADGTFTYTPNANAEGVDQFDVTVTDSGGLNTVTTVTVQIASVADVPSVPVTLPLNTLEDQSVVGQIDVTDPDLNDTHSFSVSSAIQGNVEWLGDGAFSYTPANNFYGQETFTVTTTDSAGLTADTEITVDVEAQNDAPTSAALLALVTDEDNAVNGNLALADVDLGDTHSFSASPALGNIVFNSDGTFLYTPDANVNGEDSFNVVVTDSQGATTETQVNITINAVNDPVQTPAIINIDTDEDIAVQSQVVISDADSDDSYSYEVISAGTGDLTWLGDGVFNYTPATDFNGEDRFVVRVGDSGSSSDSEIVFNIASVNDTPQTSANINLNVNEDNTVDGNLGLVDVDTGDSHTFSANPASGSININNDGSFSYSPNANFNGQDSFNVVTTDNAGAQSTSAVTVTINPVNDAPVTSANVQIGTDEDVTVQGEILVTDVDAGDTHSFEVIDPALGQVTFSTGGNYTYTPRSNWSGTDNFTVRVTDSSGATSDTTVTVNVAEVNDRPETADRFVGLNEDNSIAILLAAVDSENDTLGYTITTAAEHGTALVSANSFEYNPDANFFGTDRVVLDVSDGIAAPVPMVVHLYVSPVNDDPNAYDMVIEGEEDQNINGVLWATDVDPYDVLIYLQDTAPANGSLQLDSANGYFIYTPDAGFSGVDEFVITVSDQQGGFDELRVGVTVTAAVVDIPVNNAPEFADVWAVAATNEDEAVEIDLRATDVDGDSLSYSLDPELLPQMGNLLEDSSRPGVFTYTPDANAFGSDGFRMLVDDGNGGTDSVHVQVTVRSVNDAPTINQLTNEVGDEDTAIQISIEGVDDIEGDALTFSIGTQAANGTVTVVEPESGSYSYTADTNWYGEDTFEAIVTDENGGQVSTWVTLVVNPVNDRPNAPAVINHNIAEDGVLVSNVGASDIDGNGLSYSVSAQGQNGSVNVNSSGQYTYTPNANFNGSDSFVVSVNDGQGQSNSTTSTTVNVTVNAVNDDPSDIQWLGDFSIAENSTSGDVGTARVVDTDLSDSNVTDSHTYRLTNAAGGRFVINAVSGVISVASGASLNYEANSNHTITVEVEDSAGATWSEDQTISVTNVNETPTFNTSGTFFVNENVSAGAVVGQVNANDPDSSTLTYDLTNDAGGRFAISSSGVITTTSSLNHESADSYNISFSVTDGEFTVGDSRTVNIGDVNEAPSLSAPASFSVVENSSVGSLVGSVSATDPDSGENLTYSLTDNAGGRFAINSSSGVITNSSVLDYEAASSYGIQIRVTDSGNLTSTLNRTVNVSNVNEAPTNISWSTASGDFSIAENSSTNVYVGQAIPVDPDSGDTFSYSLYNNAGGRFRIESDGRIYTNSSAFDYDSATSHTIGILVTDSAKNNYNESRSVQITDVNYTPSDITWSGSFAIAENSGTNIQVGSASVVDADTSDSHSYSLTNNAGGRFSINTDTGAIYTASSNFDYESATSHSISVRVIDSAGADYTESRNVAVSPVNERPTDIVLRNIGNVVVSSLSVAENGTVGGQQIGSVSATDPENNAMTYSYTGGSGVISVDSSGVVSTSRQLDYENDSHSYPITITASESGNSSNSYQESFTINLTNVNEAPTLVVEPTGSDNLIDIDENVTASSPLTDRRVALLSADDPENQSVSYQFVNGENAGGRFTISGGYLVYDGSPGLSAAEYTVQVRAVDTGGVASAPRNVNITVNHQPDVEQGDQESINEFNMLNPEAGSKTSDLIPDVDIPSLFSDLNNDIVEYRIISNATYTTEDGQQTWEAYGINGNNQLYIKDARVLNYEDESVRNAQIQIVAEDASGWVSPATTVQINLLDLEERQALFNWNYNSLPAGFTASKQTIDHVQGDWFDGDPTDYYIDQFTLRDQYGDTVASGQYVYGYDEDDYWFTEFQSVSLSEGYYHQRWNGDFQNVNVGGSNLNVFVDYSYYPLEDVVSEAAITIDEFNSWTSNELDAGSVNGDEVIDLSYMFGPLNGGDYIRIASGNTNNAFSFNGTTLVVNNAQAIDYESIRDYDLTIEARNSSGGLISNSQRTVDIVVADKNENMLVYQRPQPNGNEITLPYGYTMEVTNYNYSPSSDPWDYWEEEDITIRDPSGDTIAAMFYYYDDYEEYVDVEYMAQGYFSRQDHGYEWYPNIYRNWNVSLAPIVLDLDGNGLAFSESVTFDMDMDGVLEATPWIDSNDGLLVLDRNGDGLINNGSEISFTADLAGATTDMEGLQAYDSDGNGVLDESDEKFGEFQVWQDQNQNGISEESELSSLSELGIASIDLDVSVASEPSGLEGVQLVNTGVFNLQNGETGLLGDVIFTFSEIEEEVQLDTKPDDSVAKLVQAMNGFDSGAGSSDLQLRESETHQATLLAASVG